MPIRRLQKRHIFLIFLTGVLLTLVAMNFAEPAKKITREVTSAGAIDGEQFLREMAVLLGPPMLPGNTIRDLQNGDEIFPAMLAAISNAQRSITFETYVYWSGEVGQAFADALAARARAGVPVHVLLDYVGSQKMDEASLEEMRDAGVEIERHHPIAWYTISKLNNRTHRKVLVIDGELGFTGGVGIADEWQGQGSDPEHWRDMHFEVRGPVVAQMQAVFNDNWVKNTGRVLQGPAYFPYLKLQPGGKPAQMFSSSPSGGSESMQLMYLMAIAASHHTIDLAAAYYVPDDLTEQALIDALKRGVNVRLLLAARTDSKLVKDASRARWGRLLEAGAQIHLFQPAMLHSKLFIADRFLVSVGSTNFDARSFSLNDEANLNVYSAEFAGRMTQVFEADLARSKIVTVEEWRARPWTERIQEKLSSTFRTQL